MFYESLVAMQCGCQVVSGTTFSRAWFSILYEITVFFFSYLGDHLLTIFKLCFIILDRDGFHFNDSLLYEAIHCKWRH